MQNLKIVIFGSGNVAFHLGKALMVHSHNILQVVGRSIGSTSDLAGELKCAFTLDYKKVNKNADIYILAVNDMSIAEIVDNFDFDKRIVIHTSGSTNIKVFKKLKNYGVIYPLQTFSKHREIKMSAVPLFIEANNEYTKQQLLSIANQLSDKVEFADSDKRMALHLSAVFACNFTNHMFAIAEVLLKKQDMDFNYLKPLIIETLEKALEKSPLTIQTGPAVRNDVSIIEKHMELLSDNDEYQKLYSFVSESISKFHSKQNK